MLTTKAIFERKISSFETRVCEINGIEIMDEKEFEKFSKNLMKDATFIKDRQEEMYTDSSGRFRGLLALNKDSGDGILIDSQGYDYPRYVSFMPNIKSYIDNQISIVAEQIIKEATENTSNGSWTIYFDEIEDYQGLVIEENNGIGTMLLETLRSNEKVSEIEIGGDCFDMTIYLDYCSNLDEEIKSNQSIEM